ncbi:FAD:protein FMN transferase [Luteimonas sp. gir]|uniref:FAD:protein FMN transferase n=1 Tax=Luteimonas sp. gir TaxID=3127960 RepID=UPI003075E3FB
MRDPATTRVQPDRWRAALALVLLTVLAGAAVLGLRPAVRMQAEYLVFGSRARVDVVAADRERAEAALAEIGGVLAEDHRRWHAWEPSALTQLNQALAAGRSVRPEPDLLEMIRLALVGYTRSGGLFDPAAGRLIGAWGFHTSDYPVRTAAPDAAQLQALLAQRPSMADIEVTDTGRVRSRNPAVALDLNAMAEGYAALQVQRILARHGIDDALVYIGGFVLAVGDDDGKPWPVGIRAADGMLGTLALQDGEALASSGDYERHRDGTAQGHIVDPRDGRPQRASAAASVLARDPVMADIAATALMVAGPERMVRVAHDMGLRCIAVQDHDGRLHLSPALAARLQLTAPTAQPVRMAEIDDGPC